MKLKKRIFNFFVKIKQRLLDKYHKRKVKDIPIPNPEPEPVIDPNPYPKPI
jgi:hypothetical protein